MIGLLLLIETFLRLEMHQQEGQLIDLRKKLESARVNKELVGVSLAFD